LYFEFVKSKKMFNSSNSSSSGGQSTASSAFGSLLSLAASLTSSNSSQPQPQPPTATMTPSHPAPVYPQSPASPQHPQTPSLLLNFQSPTPLTPTQYNSNSNNSGINYANLPMSPGPLVPERTSTMNYNSSSYGNSNSVSPSSSSSSSAAASGASLLLSSSPQGGSGSFNLSSTTTPSAQQLALNAQLLSAALNSAIVPPRVIPGRTASAKENHGAIDWGIQNLVAFGSQSYVVVAEATSLRILQTLDEHRSAVTTVRWSNEPMHLEFTGPYNLQLASGDLNGVVFVWNVLEGHIAVSLSGKFVVCCLFSSFFFL